MQWQFLWTNYARDCNDFQSEYSALTKSYMLANSKLLSNRNISGVYEAIRTRAKNWHGFKEKDHDAHQNINNYKLQIIQ